MAYSLLSSGQSVAPPRTTATQMCGDTDWHVSLGPGGGGGPGGGYSLFARQWGHAALLTPDFTILGSGTDLIDPLFHPV